MPKDNLIRAATFIRTIDGDTFVARLDLLPKVQPRHQAEAAIRVFGWNAAELREAEGPRMRDVFDFMLRNAVRIDVEIKAISFERIVCSVWIDDVLFSGTLQKQLRRIRGEEN
jgi:hypothetical protein